MKKSRFAEAQIVAILKQADAETEEQAKLLRLLRCDVLQGYCSADRCRPRTSPNSSWVRGRFRRDLRRLASAAAWARVTARPLSTALIKPIAIE